MLIDNIIWSKRLIKEAKYLKDDEIISNFQMSVALKKYIEEKMIYNIQEKEFKTDFEVYNDESILINSYYKGLHFRDIRRLILKIDENFIITCVQWVVGSEILKKYNDDETRLKSNLFNKIYTSLFYENVGIDWIYAIK